VVAGFPPPVADDAADHLHPRSQLPQVALPATDGPEICLASLPARSVVAVYPWTGRPGQPNPPNWDDIPGAHGSTPELEGFRDLRDRFAQNGTRIFGLSRQSTDYQRELVARLGLPFPLLSDEEGHFAAALRLPSFATGDESYLKRLTLVIAEGHIAHVFYPVRDPAGHAREVLQQLEGQGEAQSPIASSSASSTE
jgi:peroxiredoxin